MSSRRDKFFIVLGFTTVNHLCRSNERYLGRFPRLSPSDCFITAGKGMVPGKLLLKNSFNISDVPKAFSSAEPLIFMLSLFAACYNLLKMGLGNLAKMF